MYDSDTSSIIYLYTVQAPANGKSLRNLYPDLVPSNNHIALLTDSDSSSDNSINDESDMDDFLNEMFDYDDDSTFETGGIFCADDSTDEETTDDGIDGYSADSEDIGFSDTYSTGDEDNEMDESDYTHTTGCDYDDDSIESCNSADTLTPLAYY